MADFKVFVDAVTARYKAMQKDAIDSPGPEGPFCLRNSTQIVNSVNTSVEY